MIEVDSRRSTRAISAAVVNSFSLTWSVVRPNPAASRSGSTKTLPVACSGRRPRRAYWCRVSRDWRQLTDQQPGGDLDGKVVNSRGNCAEAVAPGFLWYPSNQPRRFHLKNVQALPAKDGTGGAGVCPSSEAWRVERISSALARERLVSLFYGPYSRRRSDVDLRPASLPHYQRVHLPDRNAC